MNEQVNEGAQYLRREKKRKSRTVLFLFVLSPNRDSHILSTIYVYVIIFFAQFATYLPTLLYASVSDNLNFDDRGCVGEIKIYLSACCYRYVFRSVFELFYHK